MIGAAEAHSHLPPPRENDEAALLAAAQAVEPEILEGGYRQYDITTAVLNTWDEPMEMQLRLWLPPADRHDGPYPVTAYVHGGGFMGGNHTENLHNERRSFTPSWRATLDAGIAVASLSYRRAREGGWPAPVSDTLMHLRFLRDHGAHWHLSTERFGVHGHSAGARAASLLGMVPQDAFHTGELPWQGDPVPIAAVWMWAGATLTSPEFTHFVEFGKPRHWSVIRLHHGEHAAFTDSSRHSMRIRNNWPHISTALPPLYMVRGDRDYEGDHSDAEETVALWQALGVEATLAVVPGGHSATGPSEPFVAFWQRHLSEQPFAAPQRQHLPAAQVALDQGHPYGALEILTAAHTRNDGRELPPGRWLYTAAQTMYWLPEHEGWSDQAVALAKAARRGLAEREAAAAQVFVDRGEWFRAAEAARMVEILVGDDEDMQALARSISAASAQENALFKALYAANQQLHDGDRKAAESTLQAFADDARIAAAWAHLDAGEYPQPAWADANGIDLYGPWARIQLDEATPIRLRWVAPATWELPEHLHYRNHTDDPYTTAAAVEHGFWIAETATTQAQWRALRSADDYELAAERRDLPQVRTNYLDIVDWLDALSGTHDELLARLPTEEEWLIAASAGGRCDFMAGTDLHAVHAGNVDPENPGPLPVTSTVPCISGLYGMLGGVMEWTASPDRRSARFTDDDGNFRIIAYPMTRGGAWSSMPHQLGLELRSWQRHANHQEDLGHRLVIGGGPEAADWRKAVIQR
ncbi:MAG: hypothetical protein EA402_01010, partial [Planctomycetota bacterium]